MSGAACNIEFDCLAHDHFRRVTNGRVDVPRLGNNCVSLKPAALDSIRRTDHDALEFRHISLAQSCCLGISRKSQRLNSKQPCQKPSCSVKRQSHVIRPLILNRPGLFRPAQEDLSNRSCDILRPNPSSPSIRANILSKAGMDPECQAFDTHPSDGNCPFCSVRRTSGVSLPNYATPSAQLPMFSQVQPSGLRYQQSPPP